MTRQTVDAKLRESFGSESMPLAKAVARVSAAGDVLLRDSPEAANCTAAIAAGPAVSAFCAAIYTCGPPF